MSETYNASLAVQDAVQGATPCTVPLNVIECTRKIITKRSCKHVHRATFIQSQSILDSDGNYTEYYYLGAIVPSSADTDYVDTNTFHVYRYKIDSYIVSSSIKSQLYIVRCRGDRSYRCRKNGNNPKMEWCESCFGSPDLGRYSWLIDKYFDLTDHRRDIIEIERITIPSFIT